MKGSTVNWYYSWPIEEISVFASKCRRCRAHSELSLFLEPVFKDSDLKIPRCGSDTPTVKERQKEFQLIEKYVRLKCAEF